MSTTTKAAPHKVLLHISRLISSVTKELAVLNETLLPGHTPARVPHAHPRQAAPVVPRSVQLPPRLLARMRGAGIKLAPQAKGPRAKVAKKLPPKLSDADQADIVLLLTKSTVPVTAIAKMYGVRRPSIYNIRDKHQLNVHRGNPALMAGVARYKAKRNKGAKTPVAATPPAAPLPVVTTEDAAPPLLASVG